MKPTIALYIIGSVSFRQGSPLRFDHASGMA